MSVISITVAAFSALVVFVAGFAVGVVARVAALKKMDDKVKYMANSFLALDESCKKVLSDGWYNKVVREFKRKMESAK